MENGGEELGAITLAPGELVWIKLHVGEEGVRQLGPELESFCLQARFFADETSKNICFGVVARGDGASANPQDGICAILTQLGDERSLITAGNDMAGPRVKKPLPSREQFMTDWDIVLDGPAGSCVVDGVSLKFSSKKTRGHVAVFNAGDKMLEVLQVQVRNVNKRRSWDPEVDKPIPSRGQPIAGSEAYAGPAWQYITQSSLGDYTSRRVMLHNAHRMDLYRQSKPGRLFVPAYKSVMKDMKKARGDRYIKKDWHLSGWYEAERTIVLPEKEAEKSKFVSVAKAGLTRSATRDPNKSPQERRQTNLPRPEKKLQLPRSADWFESWAHYSFEDLVSREEFEGFLAYYNGYTKPATEIVDEAILEALGDGLSSSNEFDKDEAQQITIQFLKLEKNDKVDRLLQHEILDFMWEEYCGLRQKPHYYEGESLTMHNEQVCIHRRDLTYVCAVFGADHISEDVIQEVLKIVPLRDDSYPTVDEAYDIFCHARATEGFTKLEKEFFNKTFKKFDADGSGELDMDEYEQVLDYLGYSSDKEIMEAIKEDIFFKTPDCLNHQEFLKAMRVYRTMEVAKFKELFSKYDEDGSGGLTVDELDPLVREIGYIPTVNMLKELCRLFQGNEIPDSDLEVTRENFVKFMRTFQVNEGFTQKETAMLNEGFAHYSLGRGELSIVELTGFMRWAGYACRAVEVQMLCDGIDVQETGLFDFPEVMKIFRMRRNWELARAEKILREVQDEEGNPIDRASLVELSKLV
jgi:Ca2+-binding EF-hand superfamily protein